MIELRPAFNEALKNLGNWRNKYPAQVYPHKIVLNMMYRAYSTRFVYQAYANDEMPEFDDFQEAAKYVIAFYGETALREVMPYLEGWMATNKLGLSALLDMRNWPPKRKPTRNIRRNLNSPISSSC